MVIGRVWHLAPRLRACRRLLQPCRAPNECTDFQPLPAMA
ncbi:hypothetical protein SVAN01_05915 [Stagonosporopsis vannaccii]|nr:hypothetical protein SVAN01_05915 [Stagonosporopsis vannaccii]